MNAGNAKTTVEWREDFRFVGQAPEGRETEIDGDSARGPSPVTLLLESIAACAACDVVEILRKGRQPLRGLTVEIEGDRRAEPPRHLLSLRLAFRIEGDVDRDRAERAVELSLDTYCSVFHTLRDDLDVEWELVTG